MRVHTQETDEVALTGAAQFYRDGEGEALLLFRSHDAEIQAALNAAFSSHRAPEVDVADELPRDLTYAGTCTVQDARVILEVEGRGQTLLGFRLEVAWGQTSSEWRDLARRTGCAWLCLLTEAQLDRALLTGRNWVDELPVMPILRLHILE